MISRLREVVAFLFFSNDQDRLLDLPTMQVSILDLFRCVGLGGLVVGSSDARSRLDLLAPHRAGAACPSSRSEVPLACDSDRLNRLCHFLAPFEPLFLACSGPARKAGRSVARFRSHLLMCTRAAVTAWLLL